MSDGSSGLEDYRSTEEIERERKSYFREKARRQLYEEGQIPDFCATDEQIREKYGKIENRALELEEKAELERLKKKYG